MRFAYKYRLYPNQAQVRFLENQLLYNAALQERRDAWKVCRKSIHYYDQTKQLKPIREEGLLGLANFSCCQDVLRRLDKTFQAFLRSGKARREARFPALPFVPAVRQYHLSVLRRWLTIARRREQRLKHVLYATAQQYGVLIVTMEVIQYKENQFFTSYPIICVVDNVISVNS